MPTIQNIVFDLGGVLLNIDYRRTENAFVDLGLNQFPQLYTQFYSNHLFSDLETGKIGPQDFEKALIRESGMDLRPDQIRSAWNAMLLDLPAERLELLYRLKDRYRLFLLSNTNAIHYEHFTAYVRQTYGLDSLDSLFDRAYYSHIMGLRKPFAETYRYVLDREGLNASECLFIDDTRPNLSGAQEAGMHTHWLETGQSVLDLFEGDRLKSV